jgi:hypothetical protein
MNLGLRNIIKHVRPIEAFTQGEKLRDTYGLNCEHTKEEI